MAPRKLACRSLHRPKTKRQLVICHRSRSIQWDPLTEAPDTCVAFLCIRLFTFGIRPNKEARARFHYSAEHLAILSRFLYFPSKKGWLQNIDRVYSFFRSSLKIHLFVDDTKQFNFACVAIRFILVIAGESKQIETGMPRHGKSGCFQRNFHDALPGGCVADIDEQIFGTWGQHWTVVAETEGTDGPIQPIQSVIQM